MRLDDNSMDRIFSALSNSTRRNIIQLLREKELCAGEIVSYFNLTGATISHHLNVLYKCGLIKRKQKGNHIYYAKNKEIYTTIKNWFK